MNTRYLFLFLCLFPVLCLGQKVNNDLDIHKLSDHVYEHISWHEVGQWGRVASNGLIVVSQGKALIIDTPMDSVGTKNLYHYIQDSLRAEPVSFIPGHWHDDCTGGMKYLQRMGVETYAYQQTNDILKSKGLPTAKHSFGDSFELRIGDVKTESYFLGGGHATDNIVIWIPEEQVLFGGCMVKDCGSINIGNLSDAASFEEWHSTIIKVKEKFPQAKVVVPGHGDTGGKELLDYTKKMLEGLMEK